MADDLFGGHTHIRHIDSDERDSDNTYTGFKRSESFGQ